VNRKGAAHPVSNIIGCGTGKVDSPARSRNPKIKIKNPRFESKNNAKDPPFEIFALQFI
jgi:hypothetical protein